MTTDTSLTIREIGARAVNVPLPKPLPTSSGAITTVPLVLVDLATEEGVTGCAYVFCYSSVALQPVAHLVRGVGEMLQGDAVVPAAIEHKLQRSFRLLGPQGLTGMAMAGVDMAAWDALAKAVGMPLARLLGGEPRPIPAYASYFMNGVAGAEKDAEEALAAGFRALKIKIGYPDLATDIQAIREVRRVSGDDVVLMVDYNQCLTVPQAVTRARALDDEGVYWIEEPTIADDFAGHAKIAREATTAIQIGENWWGPHDMAKSIAAGASDLAMPDVMKIGGVTGWMRAVSLAETSGLPVSSHIFQEISAQLLAVTPTCDWLEYMDLAKPILQQPLALQHGCAVASDEPGIGVSWDEGAVQQYLAE